MLIKTENQFCDSCGDSDKPTLLLIVDGNKEEYCEHCLDKAINLLDR